MQNVHEKKNIFSFSTPKKSIKLANMEEEEITAHGRKNTTRLRHCQGKKEDLLLPHYLGFHCSKPP